MRTPQATAGAVLVFAAAFGLTVAFGAGIAPAAAGPGASAGAVDQADCSYPYTATDATGTEVTLDEEPERIVTLAPSAAQTLWEFNASDKVVGVSDNAGYLEGADEKEVVTDGMTVNTEVIVELEPDVVLAPSVVSDENVESLRDNGLTVFHIEGAENFSHLYDLVEMTGELSGECEAGTATADDMRERVSAIEEAVSDEERPGALYTFYEFTTGSNTFIHSIITTAGTTNVAAEAGITGFTTEPLSQEVVANNTEDIEWLILNSDPASHPTSDVYNETTAMQENQTVLVDANHMNQDAPRTVLALETITQAIHPEAYEEAQAALEATPTDEPTATTAEGMETTESTDEPMTTEEPTDSPTATGEPVDATTTGDGPGFTAATGVLALLAAVLVFRRQ